MLSEMKAPMIMTADPESNTVMATVRNCSEARQKLARRSSESSRWKPFTRDTGQRSKFRGSLANSVTCARAIADAANRHYDSRVLDIFFNLGPQPLNMHVHQSSVSLVVVAPNLLE